MSITRIFVLSLALTFITAAVSTGFSSAVYAHGGGAGAGKVKF